MEVKSVIFLLLMSLLEILGEKINAEQTSQVLKIKRDAYESNGWNSQLLKNIHHKHSITSAKDIPSFQSLFVPALENLPKIFDQVSRMKKNHLHFSDCLCSVENKTAVCTKLLNNRIPSCVGSDITAAVLTSRQLSGIGKETFENTPNLEYLNITMTDLRRKLPNDTFGSLKKLRHLAIQEHGAMAELDVGVFEGIEQLESLYLDHNGLQIIPPNIFSPLPNLRRLNLANNYIRRLPAGIFDKNTELRELILSGTYLKGRYGDDLLRNNNELRVLILRDTYLTELSVKLLSKAENLRWLDLSQNDLQKISANTLENCPKLTYLSLTNNKLSTVSAKLLSQHNTALQRLELGGNDWVCDCDILPLAGWTVIRADAVEGKPVCQYPNKFFGMTLQDWFHNEGKKCGDSQLQKYLSELFRLSKSIANGINYTGPDDVSNIAANHFAFVMSMKTGTKSDIIVARIIKLLHKVLQSKGNSVADKNETITGVEPLTAEYDDPYTRFPYIFKIVPQKDEPAVIAGIKTEVVSVFNNSNHHEVHTASSAEHDFVRGLCEEVREVLSLLLKSIDASSVQENASFIQEEASFAHEQAEVPMKAEEIRGVEKLSAATSTFVFKHVLVCCFFAVYLMSNGS